MLVYLRSLAEQTGREECVYTRERLNHQMCATAPGKERQLILSHQRRRDRPKLADSFERINWDI